LYNHLLAISYKMLQMGDLTCYCDGNLLALCIKHWHRNLILKYSSSKFVRC